MQRGVGANLHALAAADAAGEKIGLVERARRAQQPFVAALAQAGIGAHERNQRRAGSEPRQRSAPSQIRRGDFFLFAEEAELKAVVWATAYAVHAHQALGFAPGNAADGIVAALAVEQAAVAFVARSRILVQPQHAPPGDRAQQRAQRANRPAPEPRHAQAGQQNGHEQNPQHQPLRKLLLTEIQHRELQNRMQNFAGQLDHRDMTVLQRRKRRAHGKVEGGQQDNPKDRTSRLKGSSQPMAAEPKTAATNPAISTTYLPVCQRLYLFESMRCLPRLDSEGKLPTKCCSVPMGQIQPQKKRPRKSVGSRMIRLQISPR